MKDNLFNKSSTEWASRVWRLVWRSIFNIWWEVCKPMEEICRTGDIMLIIWNIVNCIIFHCIICIKSFSSLIYEASHQPCSFVETINEILCSHSILNRSWVNNEVSPPSQIIDNHNAVLHHILKKNLWFFMKIQKCWAKKCFRSQILRKTPVWSQQILASCKMKVPIFQWFSNFTCRF